MAVKLYRLIVCRILSLHEPDVVVLPSETFYPGEAPTPAVVSFCRLCGKTLRIR